MIKEYVVDKWYAFDKSRLNEWINRTPCPSGDKKLYERLKDSAFQAKELNEWENELVRIKLVNGLVIDAEEYDQCCLLNENDLPYINEVNESDFCDGDTDDRLSKIKEKLNQIEQLTLEIKCLL
jgi:hypothetical protein